MDNYGTHKVSKVQKWLARHPRYHVHFTPTSGTWLNLVERLFAHSPIDVCRAGATPPCARWSMPCSIIWTNASAIPSPSCGGKCGRDPWERRGTLYTNL